MSQCRSVAVSWCPACAYEVLEDGDTAHQFPMGHHEDLQLERSRELLDAARPTAGSQLHKVEEPQDALAHRRRHRVSMQVLLDRIEPLPRFRRERDEGRGG